MKEKMHWKKLLVYLATGIGIALLSRLFTASDNPGWIPAAASFIISFVLYPLVSAFFLKDSKKRFAISRLILLGLVLVAGYMYYNTWSKNVCTASELVKAGGPENDKQRKRSITLGTVLREEYRDDTTLQRIQKEKKYIELFQKIGTYEGNEVWTSDSIAPAKRKLDLSLVLLAVLVSLLTMHTVESLLFRKQRSNAPGEQVFISYNHENKQEATRLAELLRANDITVIRDEDNMPAGGDINIFIKDSIRTSAITLMVVSEKSLLSGWVATEAATSFFLSDYDETRGCIACYVDSTFKAPGFGTAALKQVNEKLEKIEKDIEERNELHADSKDLNDQKTRLYKLKNNMDTILQRLQNSKCVDIAGEKLEQNFPLVLDAIKKKFEGNDEMN